MKFYENAFRVRIPYSDIYRIHQNLDFLIQEKCSIKLPYSFNIQPGNADDAHILLRTSVAMGFPGEVCRNLTLKVGDAIPFVTTLTMIQRVIDGKRKREITTPPELQKGYVIERFSRAGLELQELLVSPPEYFYVKKSKKVKAIVLPASIIRATGIVTSVEEAEKAIVYGVGRKRVFGFGLINITGEH